MGAVAESDPLRRAYQLHDLLGRLTSVELGEIFNRAVQLNSRSGRDELLAELVARWVQIDPVAAEGAMRPYLDRDRKRNAFDWDSADNAVSHAWAQALPEKALQEASSSREGPWARSMAHEALEALAKGDAAAQIEALTSLPDSKLRTELYESAIRNLAKTDPAAAEARLDSLPEPWRRLRLEGLILGKLAEKDAPAALARLAELAPTLQTGATGTQIISPVLRNVARKDPASAMAMIDQLPEGMRTTALNVVLGDWAEKEPVTVLNWAVENGVDLAACKAMTFYDESPSGSFNSLVTIALGADRAGTMEWLRAQPPSQQRDMMICDAIWRASGGEKFDLYAQLSPAKQAEAARTVAWAILQEDPPKAIAWVNDLAAGKGREGAIGAVVANQVRNAPEKIDTYLENWQPGPDRDAALGGVATQLANGTPERALTFARQIKGTNARENAFEDIAQRWLLRNDRAARAWILSAPELSPEQKRVLIRQFDER